jgi:inner membrane transporter RhtA
LSGLAYVPVGIVVLLHHPATLAAVSYALVAGVLSSAVPYLIDVLTLRRVSAQFFGVFMSINPVLAAFVGLVVLHQRLGTLDWVAILVIVAANAVAVTFHGSFGADAVRHKRVPVDACDVLHGVPELPVTPAFGKVSADGEPRSSRTTQ